MPASDLLDSRADGDDVLGGRRAAPLAERLHAASARAATRELEAAVLDWLRDASPPDPAVEAVVRTQAGGRLPVSELADGVGLSERQLHRRCTSAVGYGPKTLDRVLRFRRFLALASAPDRAGRPGSAGERPPATLATLAVDAGYADQAHLTRECVRLAGRTPAALTSTSHR